ncbi:metallophosphoesterase [Sporosarcina cyprini]|uniref:metallophosphoesterase n=1 Tax=Sporosarcina cyprini TaxID=2910523 RepID=UPI001EDF8C16|nr:metallophosphoesterase [Sporosarcina cyprini]MCG3089367.1 metallophosphoesterase [Sporosarcina cyprini]
MTIGVTSYDIHSPKIPSEFDSFRIVQLSDLHDAKFGERHAGLVKKVKGLSPDAIFITGDFIDSNRFDLDRSMELVEELESVAPFYYVTGNHEISSNETAQILSRLESRGVHTLSNTAVLIERDGQQVAVGGIDDPLSSRKADDEAVKEFILQAFQDVPDSMYKILLSHRPEQFETYYAQKIDLIMSGHAHGGQIRIPGIGGLVAPGQGWFPGYTEGLHSENQSQMIISRGIGNSIIPIRFFNQPEIVLVELHHQVE